MIIESTILVAAALFGAIVGSFLNVVILRLPEEDQSIVFPASHCTHCETPLQWYENIPLLSYLFLRGKCGHCSVHISIQYPLVEAIMAILTVALVYRFSLSNSDSSGIYAVTINLHTDATTGPHKTYHRVVETIKSREFTVSRGEGGAVSS